MLCVRDTESRGDRPWTRFRPGACSLTPSSERWSTARLSCLADVESSPVRGRLFSIKANSPPPPPHLGLQEVQEALGYLHIGALVDMDAVGPPTVEETIHQIAHAAVLLAR
jgi:hypothetical protein